MDLGAGAEQTAPFGIAGFEDSRAQPQKSAQADGRQMATGLRRDSESAFCGRQDDHAVRRRLRNGTSRHESHKGRVSEAELEIGRLARIAKEAGVQAEPLLDFGVPMSASCAT